MYLLCWLLVSLPLKASQKIQEKIREEKRKQKRIEEVRRESEELKAEVAKFRAKTGLEIPAHSADCRYTLKRYQEGWNIGLKTLPELEKYVRWHESKLFGSTC